MRNATTLFTFFIQCLPSKILVKITGTLSHNNSMDEWHHKSLWDARSWTRRFHRSNQEVSLSTLSDIASRHLILVDSFIASQKHTTQTIIGMIPTPLIGSWKSPKRMPSSVILQIANFMIETRNARRADLHRAWIGAPIQALVHMVLDLLADWANDGRNFGDHLRASIVAAGGVLKGRRERHRQRLRPLPHPILRQGPRVQVRVIQEELESLDLKLTGTTMSHILTAMDIIEHRSNRSRGVWNESVRIRSTMTAVEACWSTSFLLVVL